MQPATILILGEEGHPNQDLEQQLTQQGFKVVQSGRRTECCRLLQDSNADLTIIDSLKKDPRPDLETVRKLHRLNRNAPVFLIVQESSETKAVAAFRAGFNDYFKRPLAFPELLDSIRRHLPAPQRASADLPPEATAREPVFIGSTSRMLELKNYLVRAAATDCNVLITGETGTGKERVAELIHWHSRRRRKPMICINCAALPENLLESELFGYERGAFTGASAPYPGKLRLAEGGTVFLDEIFEMSPHMQAKLLRALDTRKIYSLGGRTAIPLNIRIVAATNRDPKLAMEQGALRRDLFYRLNVARLDLPPLRERPTDIPLFLQHFIQEMNHCHHRRVEGCSDEFLELLLAYSWPGNIRELRNLVEALFINPTSRIISTAHLPESFRFLLENLESSQGDRAQVLGALQATKWNKTRAARKLQISRMTLYRKLERLEIDVDQAASDHD